MKRPPQTIEVICEHCGGIFDWLPHGNQKARSPEQNKRFHLMIALGYQNLPAEKRAKYVNKEHFRAMMTMRAGPEYREVRNRIPIPDAIDRHQAYFLIRAAMTACVTGGLYLHPQIENGEIVIYGPRSVKFLKMSHGAFNLLNNLVQEIIEKETGREVDAMIHEHFQMKKAEEGFRRGRERAPRDIGREF